MRTFVIANSKGGSGKSTLAMNLASYFACWGIRVTLVDFDRQRSALDWLAMRPAERPEIRAVQGSRAELSVPADTDYAILDFPSGWEPGDLLPLLGARDAVIVPVLPSPLDIRAARHFVAGLRRHPTVVAGRVRVGLVANRVREQTNSYRALEHFLTGLAMPFVARLRETQNYVRAAELGVGLFELPQREVMKDLEQWQSLIAWLMLDKRLPIVPPVAALEPRGAWEGGAEL